MKMYIDAEDIKKHLNIDYDEDDGYLTQLVEAAESAIERFIQQPLEQLEDENGDMDENGDIPAALKHAVRLMVGGFYANREPVAFATATEIPFGLMFLVMQYRKLT